MNNELENIIRVLRDKVKQQFLKDNPDKPQLTDDEADSILATHMKAISTAGMVSAEEAVKNIKMTYQPLSSEN